jgi:archaea-specific DNA-binding protein
MAPSREKGFLGPAHPIAMPPDGRSAPSRDRSTVYIGPKPTMTYVFEVVAELNSGAGPVVVKARGNAIAKAVDVAEVVRRRFLEHQVEVGPVTIDTERLVNRDGREARVSSISISLTRVGPVPVAARSPPEAEPSPAGPG